MIAFLCAAVAILGALQEEPQPSLEISVLHQTLDPIDLVPVTVRWVNRSDRVLRLTLNCGQIVPEPMFSFEDPHGRRWRPVSFAPIVCGAGSTIELLPGQFVQRTWTWSPSFMRLEGRDEISYCRPQEGAWKISASLDGAGGSNTIDLAIREDRTVGADARRLFGDEAWHAFVLQRGVKAEDLAGYREFLYSKRDAPQKDLLGLYVGLRELNDGRPYESVRAFRVGMAVSKQHYDRSVMALLLARALLGDSKPAEALVEIDRIRLDPMDHGRKALIELRARATRR
jgi:hypothetical protein